MSRAVLFDFGNVLVHFDSQRMIDFIADNQRSSVVKPEALFKSELLAKYELGRLSDLDFFDQAKKLLKLRRGLEPEAFFAVFGSTMGKPDLQMLALRHALKANRILTGMVSNLSRFHYDWARTTYPETFMSFDYIGVSFRLGLRKPDPKIWRAVARRMKIRFQDAFFVDDQWPNVAAFNALGGFGHHYEVVDDRFCANGKLEAERKRLILTLAARNYLTEQQAQRLILKPR